jgi:hypothetical protein
MISPKEPLVYVSAGVSFTVRILFLIVFSPVIMPMYYLGRYVVSKGWDDAD